MEKTINKEQRDKLFGKLVTKKLIRQLEAFARRLTRHHQHHTTDDLVQMTLMRVYKNIEHYKHTFAFTTWTHRIMRNQFIDLLRYDTSRPNFLKASEIQNFEELACYTTQNDTNEDVFEDVREKLSTVDDIYRKAIYLRYFENLQYKEIAKALNVPMGTVKIRIHRGKQQLKAKFEKQPILSETADFEPQRGRRLYCELDSK